ncbi:pleckstrin homology domain-containing family M member 1 [Hyalella azteca]|uniref:Pleckstrin homology domain-containing family M member 1 n=1 Tax=Hyalella azteca TaxID=294128 RepID=A0A8B7NSW9_HYAAZ|nr:pleckstrin homology domain-containing family M member 1 [Hyalella azteca]
MTRKKAKIAEQDEVLRHQMLDYLKDVVQALLQPMGDTSKLYVRPPPSLSADHTRIPPKIFGTSDLTNNLCCSLEAVLIHGLRDSYSSRVTSFFGAPRDKMPCPNFWPVVMTVCHKDDIKEVCNLSYITSDVGRGRAWLRLMINGGQMSSYIDALTRELGVLKDYYKPSALVRQEESCCQLLGTLQPLSTLQFRLATNSSVLNTWTQTPLVLAGMWAPLDGHTVPGWSQPVELAAEMTAAESEEELQRRRREKERAEIFIEETPLNDHLLHAILSATPTTKFIGLEAAVEEESGAASRPKPLVVRTLYPRSEGDVAGALDTCTEETPEPEQPATEELLAAHVPKGDIESIDSSSLLNQSDDGSIVTSSSSLDFNTLLARRLDSVDYCYVNIEHMTLLEGAEQAESPRSVSPTGDEVYNGASKGVGCDDHSTDLTSDAERRRSSLVTQLCPQVGLDEQNYQCHQCRAFIGLFYGQFRVCAMDGHSYCVECHNNYTAVVPARVIFNWDLRQHAVADANRDWLLSCIDDPMIDIRAANPRLYEHVEELDRLRVINSIFLILYYCNILIYSNIKEISMLCILPDDNHL